MPSATAGSVSAITEPPKPPPLNRLPKTPGIARSLLLAGVDFPLVDDVALFLPVARELGIAQLRP